jgi:putative membrane protein
MTQFAAKILAAPQAAIPQAVVPSAHPYFTDHLANERTFLAWLRTAFALISLGFASNRFSEFVIETETKKRVPIAHIGAHWHRFSQFGSGMVIFGTILTFLATIHYNWIRHSIRRQKVLRWPILIWVASALAILFGMTSVALLVWE